MGCLKGGVVANIVVPGPGYVAFSAHYGFRPDFCEAADADSQGIVENLAGYAKSDLAIPAGGWHSIAAANEAARTWCDEVKRCVCLTDCPIRMEKVSYPALRCGKRPPQRQTEIAHVPELRPRA